MSSVTAIDLIRRDIREVITDILTIKVSINSLPAKERKEIWEFVSREISGMEKYVTKEQLTVVHDIFYNIRENE